MKIFNYVLFVDDEYSSNYYHEFILKNCDLVNETGSFLSARKALKYFRDIKAGIPNKMPDIIFLDINMPEVDGFEFIDLFQGIQLEESPIIIIISTTLNPNEEEKAKKHPLIFNFINKPLTLEFIQELSLKVSEKVIDDK